MSAAVQDTSIDAAVSKLSAIDLGYFADPFLHVLVPERARKRRSPVINRGYFARHAAFELVIARFLESWPALKHQIISLGAGSETTWFRLKQRQQAPHLYVELDMPDVVSTKIKAITTHALFSDLIVDGHVAAQGASLDSAGYKVFPMDLTQDVSAIERALVQNCGVDLALPTLFVSECVLVYVDPVYSARLIEWAGALPKAAFVTYEQILPDDMFGKTMLHNLKSRGLELKGIVAHPTLEAQTERFKSRGWAHVDAMDLKHVYYSLLPAADRARVERLEIFDEFEEFHLMMTHYSLCVAFQNGFAWSQAV